MDTKLYEMLYEIRPENEFKNSNDFIGDALLDSLDILELVSMIEDEYKIELVPDEIIPENFVNVRGIISLINKYKN